MVTKVAISGEKSRDYDFELIASEPRPFLVSAVVIFFAICLVTRDFLCNYSRNLQFILVLITSDLRRLKKFALAYYWKPTTPKLHLLA